MPHFHILGTQALTVLDDVWCIFHIFHMFDSQALTLDEVGQICNIFHILDTQALTLLHVDHVGLYVLDTRALTLGRPHLPHFAHLPPS